MWATAYPGAFALARLARWRRLLSVGQGGLLSEQALRGLVGELLFLKNAILTIGAALSVAGWEGPFDAPKDFQLAGEAYEIKTISLGAATVSIASINQLDAAPGILFLVVYELSAVPAGSSGAITPIGLVEEIRTALVPHGCVLEDFNARLLAAGFEDQDPYRKMYFRVDGQRSFIVREGFPRLTRSELPHAIADASYELLLADCEAFRT